MRIAALLLALTLVVLPAVAQSGTVASTVQAGDAEVGDRLLLLSTTVAFIDSDRDGKLDHDDPLEPVYLDAHDDGVLNRGDVRLTAGLGAAGTSVELGDDDFGLEVLHLTAWFAKTARGDWFVDVDGSRTVSGGDIRLTGAQAGERVEAFDSDVGTATPTIQAGIDPSRRIGWTDPDGDGRVDPGEGIYLDMEYSASGSPQEVAAGDLRFDNRVAPDSEPTPDPEPQPSDGGAMPQAEPDAMASNDDDDDDVEWGVILGVVSLVGVAGLAFLVLRKKAE